MSTEPRVALVVTGDCERRALPAALGRLFPQVVFELVPGRHESFTSGKIPPAFGPGPVESAAEKLAAAALGAVTDRRPADYAIVIDDLEVENLATPGDVVAHFCGAARYVLQRERNVARSAQCLRERCSVHLLVPMVEGLFFADSSALRAAGVPLVVTVQRAAGDVEAFCALDRDYLGAPDEPRANRRRGLRRWASGNRQRHPKHYLTYLTERCGSEPYAETTHGGAALAALDWSLVFADQTESCFARSLAEDLALMLDVPSPFPGSCAPPTFGWAESRTLRNA